MSAQTVWCVWPSDDGGQARVAKRLFGGDEGAMGWVRVD